MTPLEFTPRDQPALLALNNLHANELSHLTADRFAYLLSHAFWSRHIAIQAFILTFDEHAAYDSPNFQWFRARYDHFIYIDRVVVAPSARNQGLARLLYQSLFAAAQAAAHTIVVCEVNADPPNPASDAFHAAMAFTEVGAAHIDGCTKRVRYFARDLG
jgi:predicted GNAT superfamily acetyltransferase